MFQSALAIYLLSTTNKIESFDRSIRKLLLVLFVHLSTKFLLLNFIGDTFWYTKAATGFTFFYGPFLFIMAKKMLQKPLAKKMAYVHLTPFFLLLFIYFSIAASGYFGLANKHQVAIYNNVYQVFAILSLIGYSMNIKWKLKANSTDNNEVVSLQKKLLGSIASVLLFGILSGLLIKSLHVAGYFFNWLTIRVIIYSNLLLIPVLVIRYKLQSNGVATLALSVLPQPEEAEPTVSIVEVANAEAIKKYQKSGIEESFLMAYEEKIKKHMKKSKPYLNADLSLEELSKQLSIPKHHITQTFSDKIGKSFYQFINEFRIQEAISRMQKNKDDSSLLSLAFDVGFNSKSSFNIYFKKITGQTPSSYRKSLLSTSKEG